MINIQLKDVIHLLLYSVSRKIVCPKSVSKAVIEEIIYDLRRDKDIYPQGHDEEVRLAIEELETLCFLDIFTSYGKRYYSLNKDGKEIGKEKTEKYPEAWNIIKYIGIGVAAVFRGNF